MDHADGHINRFMPPDSLRDDEVIDQVLRLVADQHRALGALIGRPGYSPSIAELRSSRLGRELRALAQGQLQQEEITSLITEVRDVLLRPAASEATAVPTWFWRTGLGRMLAAAEREALGHRDLLTLPEASIALHTAEADLRRLMASGVVAWLPDEAGEPLVTRSTIDRLRSVTAMPAADESAGYSRMTA